MLAISESSRTPIIDDPLGFPVCQKQRSHSQNKKTATPSITSMHMRRQQEWRPSTPSANSRSSATALSTCKRKTNNHSVMPPTQEKRPRTQPLTTDDIPGIVQAVVNALSTNTDTPPTRDGRPTTEPVTVRIAP